MKYVNFNTNWSMKFAMSWHYFSLLLLIFSLFSCETKRSEVIAEKKNPIQIQKEEIIIDEINNSLPATIKTIIDRMMKDSIVASNCSIGMRLGGMVNADTQKIYGTVRCGNVICFFQVDMLWPTTNPNHYPQEFLDIHHAWNNRSGPALEYSVSEFYIMDVAEPE